MPIIIEKIDMPSECHGCIFEDRVGGCVLLNCIGNDYPVEEFDEEWRNARKEGRRLKYCPLKEKCELSAERRTEKSRYIDRYINADALLAWYDERRAEAHYRLMDGKKRSVRREARTEVSLFDQMYFKICKLIEQTPDVEEVRHGMWRDEREDFGTYVCSVCNRPYGNQYNYCPNCGARMQKEKEE